MTVSEEEVARVEFQVLGPLEVRADGNRVPLAGARRQRLLAGLLTAPNSMVPMGRLIEAVFGDEPPDTAVKQVQNSVSVLRERLHDSERLLIVTEESGYRICVRENELDSLQFTTRLAESRRRAAEDDLDGAISMIGSALGLWRGPALDGLGSEALMGPAARLEEQRLGALELCARWRLEFGQHQEVVDELSDLALSHPLREGLHAQLITALDRCGRRAEALHAFHRLSTSLVQELGVGPGAGLQRLHEQILAGHSQPGRPPRPRRGDSTRPVTTLPTPRTAAATSASPAPRQLPHAIRDFTGRTDHLAALDALLPPGGEELGSGQAVVISALDGSGGVGKTTLAVYWAHRVQHRFPDGTLHTDLRGYGPGRPATAAEVLDDFLVALGVPPAAVPAGTGARSGLYRTMAAGRRILIVLDNANSSEQVRALLPGTPGCMVLVTSRDSLSGLVVTEAAHRLTVDVLTNSEATALVVGIIGPHRAATESSAVDDLVGLCAGLPLALRIAAGRAAAHPNITVADIVAELTDEDSALDALSRNQDPRAAVRTVFTWSYDQLTPPQARLFRHLGLHPGPDISTPAAAALAGLTPREARSLLSALADAHLIEPVARDRYRFHDLLRAYAAELAHHRDTERDHQHAREAVLTWYTHTAHTADRQIYPTCTRLTTTLITPPHPHPHTDRDRAWDWLTTERTNLVAALHHAVDHRLDQHAVQLIDALGFLVLTGAWEDRISTATAALHSARRTGAPEQEANVLLARGEALAHLRRPEAEPDLTHAATLAQDTGNIHLQIAARTELGQVTRRQNRLTEALRHFENALTLSRGFGPGRWEAVTEGNLADLHADLGNHHQAIDHGTRSARLRRAIGDTDGEACALATVARGWQGTGDHHTALTHARHAVDLGRTSIGSHEETLARPLTILATSLHHLGHAAEAVACWREAAQIYADKGLDADANALHRHIRTATPPPNNSVPTPW
ncbi:MULTISPECIES: BTAD domain-containing putative transcriptional regulator [Streptomyces]|uniref:AfsR/SARP family transcriptional regulator n=1 Tax=Streptomyces TaxID=1883 RepID=UPI0013150E26|nr:MULTISPECIES: BTAD domain-containing putative transcriptional regulator [Streptomyces]